MDGAIAMAGNHHHLIDIAADANLGAAPGTTDGGAAPVGGAGGNEKKWLRKLTSATVNTAVLRDLISRTPMLWYLGESSGTIFRPCARRERVEALHAVRAVAIGPFHRGDRGLPFPDDAKLPFMRYLQDQCGLDVDGYVAALSRECDRLRDEFSVDGADSAAAGTLDDEDKFLEMLLLDSCFVLVVSMMLSKAGTGDDADSVARAASINRDYFILHMAVAQHADDIKLDMLVLENQVPLAAVRLLAASCPGLRLRHSVEELVLGCFDDICPKRTRCAGDAAGEFHHVLHLFHWSRVPKDKYCVLSTPRKLLKIKKQSERLFPCAMELRRLAVWFRQASSSSCGDLDMRFWRHPASPVAVMSVPCFHVHEYSAAVLHNLVAFEKHFYWAHGACVTAHVARMEGLVRCQQDAAMLRKRGVLASTRRTDAELVALFRELGEETVGARLPDEYGEMLDAVARHRGRRVSSWCGGFVLHFFPSPWVAVSLAAAVALIFVPSMLQTVYTMLGYLKE
ncbi:uncharacterized protein LOC120660127 [Panicum virgatum]|uniref:Uncharacterized protein n=1 Tax=Panicum virgatum TaxID=38727 RepID=A0A8T0VGD3_PANVG|nr:uncharacterized protein LOC120660127 [Panicum virgatum]KAG2633838.1 hypothetical protein PVAP13_2NG233100 [Panicum virgatum]